MGECSETSWDSVGGSDWDRIMRGHPNAQGRVKALIKSDVQMMRQSRNVSLNKWSARFRAGCESGGDDQRPGQANTIITSDLIDKVDDLVCAAWGPKQLTDQQKELCMGLALQHLFRYQEDTAFMKRIVTGDETWCHHYEPETKRDSMIWKHASSPPLKVQSRESHTNGTGQVQMGDVRPSSLQSGHVALRFPCVWSTEETPERETLQLGRRTQGHCEGLGLVTAT
ncbi:histone-lysine N-methyltransferase SETMAR [Trichonephila clavipes]|nr:histone-lysine N-methyltransferase SETMAR [Trichonephila clavipes]